MTLYIEKYNIMRNYGIPDKMVRVIAGIYVGFECAVVDGSVTSDWFMIKSGVKQGCVMWNFTTELEDLDFADDIALLSSNVNDLHEKTGRLAEEAEGQSIRSQTKLGGRAGKQPKELHKTESVRQTAWRPYAPKGAMRLDDDEFMNAVGDEKPNFVSRFALWLAKVNNTTNGFAV